MGILESIGRTPLVQVEGIFIKLECSNPGGSVKDRIARFMLEEAVRRGELKPGDTIVEATSGNTGIALAMVGRLMGFRVLILMPEHMSAERCRMMEAFGAEVRLTPRSGGFEEAIDIRNAIGAEPGYFVPDQFGNPDNTLCHAATTGPEISDALLETGHRRLDWFVAGTGTGGTLMGVAEALRRIFPEVRIAAVEPEESAVMSGGEAGEHGIQGIGDGFIPDLVDMDKVDEVVCVSTAGAREEAGRIRTAHGYCVGMSAGATFLAARRLAARGKGTAVATVWPDCADRYGSMGLETPVSSDVRCPLKEGCVERTRAILEA